MGRMHERFISDRGTLSHATPTNAISPASSALRLLRCSPPLTAADLQCPSKLPTGTILNLERNFPKERRRGRVIKCCCYPVTWVLRATLENVTSSSVDGYCTITRSKVQSLGPRSHTLSLGSSQLLSLLPIQSTDHPTHDAQLRLSSPSGCFFRFCQPTKLAAIQEQQLCCLHVKMFGSLHGMSK